MFKSLDGVAERQVVGGTSRQALLDAVNSSCFDVFHFLGHGTANGGQGQLALVDNVKRTTDLISGRDLASALLPVVEIVVAHGAARK